MSERFIKNIKDLNFKPFDNYGKAVQGMSWHKISYDRSNGGFGTYILKMDPGALGAQGLILRSLTWPSIHSFPILSPS